jgi:hypothetical protein
VIEGDGVMATTMVRELLFELAHEQVEITLRLDGEGGARRLSCRTDTDERGFGGVRPGPQQYLEALSIPVQNLS